MALTMSRTRTQTALTKMATLLANLNGELEFVRALLEGEPAHRDALTARGAVLQQKREAVIAAIRQFDPNIDPEDVGTAEGWRALARAISTGELSQKAIALEGLLACARRPPK